MWSLWALAARAQDTSSGSDLLDLSRRAAVVDQVLADHLAQMRDARTFGTDQRFRMAMNSSYYLVSNLRMTTPEDGTFDVQLSRAYSGFLVDLLGKPGPDGSPGEQVAWVTGGGLAYGLSRPFVLPMPAVDGEPADPSPKNDLAGAQYSDEQYTAGGRWRGFAVSGVTTEPRRTSCRSRSTSPSCSRIGGIGAPNARGPEGPCRCGRRGSGNDGSTGLRAGVPEERTNAESAGKRGSAEGPCRSGRRRSTCRCWGCRSGARATTVAPAGVPEDRTNAESAGGEARERRGAVPVRAPPLDESRWAAAPGLGQRR
jgi:hypothetical protein